MIRNGQMCKLNSLVSCMLSNDAPSTTGEQQQQPTVKSIKRNLFNIKLNHEQLKQDLNQMWKEQIEIKNVKWNFDFENLKPLEHVSAAGSGGGNASNGTQTAQLAREYDNTTDTIRYKWNPISVNYESAKAKEQINSDEYLMAAIKSSNDDDYSLFEDHEEEDDDALTIPQFYKYQRRLKLNEDKNRLNILNNNNNNNHNANSAKEQPKHSSPKMLTSKANVSKSALVKPKPTTSRSRKLKFQPIGQQEIITFSENRKDTLRSARQQKLQKSPSQNRLKLGQPSAFNKVTKSTTESSSSSSNMKQQTLLDMFKQRKRRVINATNGAKTTTTGETLTEKNLKLQQSNIENTHFLRSHNLTSIPGKQ